ncbi:class I SAM-dependent methyltransferase [Pseudoxanthomonas wuyuanensis]|uniref:Methionine biosynthesis protein MetW n=1 Tax=Pseudoxanthomonas wuyuanensis TaxID=1073196 RepID=A0A286DCN8_9GAMM|nr:class I SAM-dependent methyltransferase [Pseudoxanthomonas wuyuanensis]KAF1719303.1 class I SAM-dependent methyltransferase [Pseudoxanthomonas wuyuanensis]SOD56369.1 Methionine biosynthesis protein MetW [Pseudoxanthomonas wuyuanensis]
MAIDFDARYTEYQANRSWLRRWVRKIYLNSAASQLTGPTLDFGCGIGELLERLPAGSRGLEYNFTTVELCRSRGLAVDRYDGFADDWRLTVVPYEVRFDSMVISHVLEHLERPTAVLHSLLHTAASRNIGCVLVIVPGKAGYRIDATHRTFVDHEMLSRPDVVAETGFRLERLRYFPGNWRRLGEWFPHHELQALYRRC